MTTSKPPKYLSSIFNSFYYTEVESASLTQDQADLRYLRKNTTDTATALETFNAGITVNNSNLTVNNGSVSSLVVNTTSLGSQAEGGGLDIGASQSTGTLNIGNLVTRTGNINIATTKNTSSAQEIVLGSSNALATGQIIRINRPLTIGYTPSTRTNFNQIGYYNHSFGSSSGAITSTHNYLVHSVSSVPDGTYIIIGNITCLGTGCTITLQEFGITTVTPPIPTGALTYYPSASVKTSNTFNPLNGTYIVNFSTVCEITGGTIYLSQNTTYTGGTYSVQGRLIITRIG